MPVATTVATRWPPCGHLSPPVALSQLLGDFFPSDASLCLYTTDALRLYDYFHVMPPLNLLPPLNRCFVFVVRTQHPTCKSNASWRLVCVAPTSSMFARTLVAFVATTSTLDRVRICVAARKQKMKRDRETFHPSTTWKGSMEGYVFKRGSLGQGNADILRGKGESFLL